MAIVTKASAFIRLSGKRVSPAPIGLQDVLKFEKTAKRQIAIIREKGFRFPTNHHNGVYQAAAELQRLAPGKIGVRISIQKKIPPKKGLGSWASASAKAMLALNRLWDLKLSEKRLMEIGKKVNPPIVEALKLHFQNRGQPKSKWAIVAIPKLIEIDRVWIQALAKRQKTTREIVAENHFPDLSDIKRGLAKAGWGSVGMSGQGPAIAGFSEKRIGFGKIPKKCQSKLGFVWIGKCL